MGRSLPGKAQKRKATEELHLTTLKYEQTRRECFRTLKTENGWPMIKAVIRYSVYGIQMQSTFTAGSSNFKIDVVELHETSKAHTVFFLFSALGCWQIAKRGRLLNASIIWIEQKNINKMAAITVGWALKVSIIGWKRWWIAPFICWDWQLLPPPPRSIADKLGTTQRKRMASSLRAI